MKTIRNIQRVLIILTTLIVSALALAQNSNETSATADSRALTLPPDFFPIMCWEPFASEKGYWDHPQNGLASAVECGFNALAFVRPKHLPLCEKLGVKAIVLEPTFRTTWKNQTDAQVTSAVGALIQEAGESPALLGYFILDEPGAAQYPQLATAVNTVMQQAPGKLAYINLFPDYAIVGAKDISQLEAPTYDAYLSGFVDIVKPQMVSYDNYRIQFSNDQNDTATAAGYYKNLLAIRSAAMKAELPFWNIVASSQIIPHGTPPSPANLLLQAYTTLAAGAQGLTWYTYYSYGYANAPVDEQMHRTAVWGYLKMVNEQLKVLGPMMRRLASKGVYFHKPLDTTLPQLPGEFVVTVQSDSPLMIGEFNGPEAKYVMVVNLNLERSTRVTLKMDSAKALTVISPVDGSSAPFPTEKGLWLTAGAGALIRQ